MPQCNLTLSLIGSPHCELCWANPPWLERRWNLCSHVGASFAPAVTPVPPPTTIFWLYPNFSLAQENSYWVLHNRDRCLGFLLSHKINNIHFGALSLQKQHNRSTIFDIGFPLVYLNRKFFGTVVPLETHYDRLTKKLQVITSS